MLAVIPARGGSKGLPGKNIIDLKGKPLIAYTIEAALNAEGVSRVVVSTDCEEIASVARSCGAEVPFLRPAELASDTAIAIDVYTHIFQDLEADCGSRYENMIVLLPTCPLRKAGDIDAAIQIFIKNNASSVVSYTREDHPIRWHQYLSEDGKFIPIFDATIRNRQSERPSYYPNGAIYIFEKALIMKGKYYDENSYAYVMPRERSVDIDTQFDLKYAEFLLEQR